MSALRETNGWATNYARALSVYARYCFLAGDSKKAERLLMNSIRLSKRMGIKYDAAKGLYEYGKLLELRGQAAEAKKNYETACQIFGEIGAKSYEKRVSQLLGVKPGSSDEGIGKESVFSKRLANIIHLGQSISSILDLGELYEKVISIAVQVTGAERGYLIITDGNMNDFKVVAGINSNERNTLRDDFSKSIIYEVLRKGQAVLSVNAMEDKKLFNYQSVLDNELKSVLCMPIKYNNEIKGACYVDNTITRAAFTKEDIDVLNVIITQAAISLENARLYQIAVTDGLTGLVIYKHLIYLLQKEVERSEKLKQCLSFMLIDVDGLGNINDSYGYSVGDQVLVRISEIVKTCVKNSGLIARYGGDEIGVILPSIDNIGAEIMAGEIMRRIEEVPTVSKGKKIPGTVSIGVVSHSYHSLNSEIMIKYAFEALQVSKKNGKNRLTVFKQDD